MLISRRVRWHGQLNEFAALQSRMCEFRCSFSNFVIVIRLEDENEASYSTSAGGKRVARKNCEEQPFSPQYLQSERPLYNDNRVESCGADTIVIIAQRRGAAVVTGQTTDHISVSLHGKRLTQ